MSGPKFYPSIEAAEAIAKSQGWGPQKVRAFVNGSAIVSHHHDNYTRASLQTYVRQGIRWAEEQRYNLDPLPEVSEISATTNGATDMADITYRHYITIALAVEAGDSVEAAKLLAELECAVRAGLPTGASIRERGHRFGSPPEPVANPSAAWCETYADWYHQGLAQ
jgi:hypothetical protein